MGMYMYKYGYKCVFLQVNSFAIMCNKVLIFNNRFPLLIEFLLNLGVMLWGKFSLNFWFKSQGELNFDLSL